MIFVGLLAALAYPNFVKQSGKARESEVKFVIGSVNRAQQAYHWEKKQFAQGTTDAQSLILLNLTVRSNYYGSLNIVGDTDESTVSPDNLNWDSFQLRAYSGGMFAGAGNYSQIMCRSLAVAENMPPPSSPTDCGINTETID